MKAIDQSKDQSYVLFGLRQEQLRRLLLPVGWYTKTDLRELAREAGLDIADKADSQDICFIPGGDYRKFLQLHREASPGDVVDMKGNVLAQHQGIDRYTIGQRKGLGIADPAPLYVVRIEPETRRVVVGPEEALLSPGLIADGMNWVSGTAPSEPVEVTIKIRYKATDMPATLVVQGSETRVWFDEPQRAVTPGQAAVFYREEELLGGGYIVGPLDSDATRESITASVPS